ncbi:hypothetical protein J6590_096353, partial [Homalodisca vitripennis]
VVSYCAPVVFAFHHQCHHTLHCKSSSQILLDSFPLVSLPWTCKHSMKSSVALSAVRTGICVSQSKASLIVAKAPMSAQLLG